jgi:anti-sigma B factor antagonist
VHRLQVDREFGATVVSGEGELDAYAAPDLSAIFDSMGADRVVVDLDAVSFMDSTALGLVVRAVRVLSERGGQVRVVLPRSAARRIFEITTLDGTLPVCSSREAALEELEELASER